MSGISTDPGFNRQPKYKAYEVVDVHTGEVIGVYRTRREANGNITEASHRVRGSYSRLKGRQKKVPRSKATPVIRASRDRRLPGKARIRARRSK